MNTDMILPVVLDLLVKSTGLLLLAFAVQSLWRRASAAQRCLMWGTTFAVLVLLPLTVLVTPRWSFALKKAPVEAPPVVSVVVPMEEIVVAPTEVIAPSEPAPVARTLPKLSVLEIVIACWLAVTACVLGWRALGAWQVRKLRRNSAVVGDERVRRLITRLAGEIGVRRRIRSHASPSITVPLTWGALRPVLLLPEAAASWKNESLTAALRHELGHIRHWDALTRLLGTLVCALYWPNVLVWLAAKAWRTAQEQACDDLVLRAGASTQDYAMQLLDAARGLNAGVPRQAPVMAMARPSTLESRLTSIMDETRDRRPVRGGAWFAGAGALTAALFACAALQLRAEEKAVPSGEKPQAITLQGGILNITESVPAVEISAQLIEVTSMDGSGLPEGLSLAPDQTIDMTEEKLKEFVAKLKEKKGVSVLAAPKVVTRNGQVAKIEVASEFGAATPLEGRDKVGVFLTLQPQMLGKDTLTLAVEGYVREFHGFRDQNPIKPIFIETKLVPWVIAMEPGKAVVQRTDLRDNAKEGADGVKRSAIFAITTKLVKQEPMTEMKGDGTIWLDVDVKLNADTANAEVKDPAGPAKGTETAKQKAERIIIPQISFNGASFEEAVEFLVVKAKEHDPDKKGINIIIGATPPGKPQLSLELKEVPLSEALKYVSELAGLKLRYDDAAVVIVAKDDAQTKSHLSTTVFKMPENFIKNIPPVEDARPWLQSQGVKFGSGSSALFTTDKSKLVVRNTAEEVRKVEAIIKELAATDTADAPDKAAGDLYLTAFRTFQDGEATEKKGDKEGAIQKYLEAQKLIKNLVRQHPKWRTDVVAYRLDVVEQNLFRLGQPVTRSAATGAGGEVRPNLPSDTSNPGSAALARAEKIVIPSLKFAGATVSEAVEFLRIKSRDFDTKEKDVSKKGVNILLTKGAGSSTAMITLDLKDIPLSEAVRYVAQLAGLTFYASRASLVIEGNEELMKIQAASAKLEEPRLQVKETVTAKPATENGKMKMQLGPDMSLKADSIVTESTSQDVVATGNVILTKGSMIQHAEKMIIKKDGRFLTVGPAKTQINYPLSFAERIIVPSVEFRDATAGEVIEFLHAKAAALDPEKKGVSIVLRPAEADRARPKVTLSLKQVSLYDALAAVAQLAGLKLKMEPYAILLE